jgi:CheY-like chemotaxis protein
MQKVSNSMISYTECDLRGLRVLLVEDEYLSAMAIEALLLDLGCELVGPATTLDDALSAVDKDAPDGVILDLNLRGQRSDPVAEALAARGIPFIVLSGYASGFQRLEGFGDMPQLRKPTNADTLIETMLRTFLITAEGD